MEFITKYLGDIEEGSNFFYNAPDGSIIRQFPSGEKGGIAHCILPKQGISKAVKHKTVEELWYCLSGKGKFWRKLNDVEEEINVSEGMYFTIPVETHFQFKNEKDVDLIFLISTIPVWPGSSEAVPVDDHWF